MVCSTRQARDIRAAHSRVGWHLNTSSYVRC